MSVQFVEEYHTVDKSDWGRGLWTDEPDKAVWVDEETGLDCMIVRNRLGALCGYAGVPESHPWFGRSYNQSSHECDDTCDEGYCDKVYAGSPEATVNVHGGLTYADACQPVTDHSGGICHIPQDGRPDVIWWFGFDCAHSQDIVPSMAADYRRRYEEAKAAGDAEGIRLWGHTTPGWMEQYRDVEYVTREVERLARQLAAVQ